MKPSEIIEVLFGAINNQDLDNFGALLSEEAVFYFPKAKPFVGRENVLKFMKILFRKFPVLQFETSRIVADDRRAAVEWTNEGHDRSQNPYANAGVTLIEIESGKIVYISDTFKNTELF